MGCRPEGRGRVRRHESQVLGGVDWTTYALTVWFDGELFVDPAGGAWGIEAEGTVRFDGASTHRISGGYADLRFVHGVAIAVDGSWWFSDGRAVYRWEPSL